MFNIPVLHGFSVDDLVKFIGNQVIFITKLQNDIQTLSNKIEELEKMIQTLKDQSNG